MQLEAQVLSVKRYRFKDESSGRMVEGCKVATLGAAKQDENFKGNEVLTYSAPYTVYDNFQKLPGEYTLDVEVVTGSKAVTLKVVGARQKAKV